MAHQGVMHLITFDACLAFRKLMTGVIAESMYTFVEGMIYYQIKKGCRRKTRGTKDQLLIKKLVFSDCKKDIHIYRWPG